MSQLQARSTRPRTSPTAFSRIRYSPVSLDADCSRARGSIVYLGSIDHSALERSSFPRGGGDYGQPTQSQRCSKDLRPHRERRITHIQVLRLLDLRQAVRRGRLGSSTASRTVTIVCCALSKDAQGTRDDDAAGRLAKERRQRDSKPPMPENHWACENRQRRVFEKSLVGGTSAVVMVGWYPEGRGAATHTRPQSQRGLLIATANHGRYPSPLVASE